MKREISDFLEDLQKSKSVESLNVNVFKQSVILRLLSMLNWNVFDIEQIYPELEIDGGKADFALRRNGKNKAFIFVEKNGEDLEKFAEKVSKLAQKERVRLLLLTNGINWRFYLPLSKEKKGDKKFYDVDLYSVETEDFAKNLIKILNKNYVITGRAINNIEEIYKAERKGEVAEKTLPKAWEELVSDQNDTLFTLIGKTTKNICGREPSREAILNFVKNLPTKEEPKPKVEKPKIASRTETIEEKTKRGPGRPPKSETKKGPGRPPKSETKKGPGRPPKSETKKGPGRPPKSETKKGPGRPPKSASAKAEINKRGRKKTYIDYTGKELRQFEFNNEVYKIDSWKKFLIKILELLYEKHEGDFDKVLEIKGRKKPYYSTNPDQLTRSELIGNSGIYCEINFGARDLVRLVRKTLEKFGYSLEDLNIKTN